MNYLLSAALIVFTSLVFSQCKPAPETQASVKVAIPVFDANRAFENIRQQVEFGPRVVNMPGHAKTRKWLVENLESYGFKVEEQDFPATLYTGEKVKGTNIIARHNPRIAERLLLGAHWDTRPFADKDSVRTDEPIPGADDGASGVGVLLEVARLIHENPIPMGLDMVFFDLEDYGDPQGSNVNSWGLGSQFWAKTAKKAGYKPKYGLFLDMVGAENARFTIEGLSAAAAPEEVTKIWRLAIGMGRDNFFIPKRTEAIVDDHRFVFDITGIPVVNIVNHGGTTTFAHYHHRHSDDLDIISTKTLSAVGQVVIAVIYKESNREL